jgi:hypothetical protein
MARVFTTEILFKLRHYRTIVIIHDTNDGLHIKVRLMDAHHLFENDSIEFVGLKGYKNLNNLKPEAIAFLQEVSDAIAKYLFSN